MKAFVLLACVALTTAAYAVDVEPVRLPNSVYGYLKDVAIPEGEKLRAAEEAYLNRVRIVGGSAASEGQFPYQAGLLLSMIGLEGTGICGGVLISPSRVATAAHCWFDGRNQAWKATVVLGSNLLFSGGSRIDTSAVAVHPNWQPLLVRNDIAVLYLPNAVTVSSTIAPVALPSGDELSNDFVGATAVASGFGLTSDGAGISTSQFLSQVTLSVISNSICSYAFPLILQPSNICTSGIGGVGTCSGDSGGPLVTTSNGRPVLIGLTSFGSAIGCESLLPAAYVRVTSYIDFLNQHI